MKTLLYPIFFLIGISSAVAQVGIGTDNPATSSIVEVASTNKGMLLPRMNTTERNNITAPATGLHVFDTTLNDLLFYDGTSWNSYGSQAKLGDIKSGIQATDHGGWFRLDGRSISNLTTAQQSRATTLGITTKLPDATNTYLLKSTTTIGSVQENSTTIAVANLPSVAFAGTAASAGSHKHSYDAPNSYLFDNGNHTHSNYSVSTAGDHGHTHNANGGTGNGKLGLVQTRNGGYTWPSGNNDQSSDQLNVYAAPQQLVIQNSANYRHSFTTDSANIGNHQHLVDIPITTSNTTGAHTHTVSVASGGSGTALTLKPKTLSVNMFIYLGN
ncbi:hypothetical protein RCH18_000327 [Flavobacterium sp. PL11]|jgi:hypothetical protein|uniref:hypothetical protein n=1 Tax=Flavobacterium sp. PL11 TaxID=3071717 RepID=UPI002E06B1F1|nr:hypothetical protein [Flavobacterium sp. PL11]